MIQSVCFIFAAYDNKEDFKKRRTYYFSYK